MSRLPLIAGLGLFASSLVFSACKEPEAEEFGFTCVELLQAASEDSDPFVGTAQIEVKLRYESCLINYFTKSHNENAMNGVDGAELFEEWKERLCSESVSDPLVPCEVESIVQELVDSEQNPIYQATVTYNITDASKINSRTLLWGPGPVQAYADCQAGDRPFVRLGLPSDIIGYNAAGDRLWSALSWKNQRGVMQRSTAGCIQAEISRSGI